MSGNVWEWCLTKWRDSYQTGVDEGLYAPRAGSPYFGSQDSNLWSVLPITRREALRIGLVSRVVPDEKLMSEAHALAERIAVNPPRAVRLAKRLLREAQHGRLHDVLELSAAFQALAHETADHKEAVEAFTAKRPPKFTGA